MQNSLPFTKLGDRESNLFRNFVRFWRWRRGGIYIEKVQSRCPGNRLTLRETRKAIKPFCHLWWGKSTSIQMELAIYDILFYEQSRPRETSLC